MVISLENTKFFLLHFMIFFKGMADMRDYASIELFSYILEISIRVRVQGLGFSGYEHRVHHHCHHQQDTARRLTNVTVAADRSSINGSPIVCDAHWYEVPLRSLLPLYSDLDNAWSWRRLWNNGQQVALLQHVIQLAYQQLHYRVQVCICRFEAAGLKLAL